jgi:hypothetical protein
MPTLAPSGMLRFCVQPLRYRDRAKGDEGKDPGQQPRLLWERPTGANRQSCETQPRRRSHPCTQQNRVAMTDRKP